MSGRPRVYAAAPDTPLSRLAFLLKRDASVRREGMYKRCACKRVQLGYKPSRAVDGMTHGYLICYGDGCCKECGSPLKDPEVLDICHKCAATDLPDPRGDR